MASLFDSLQDDEFLDQLYVGDCIEGMQRLPAGSIDLVFADPPFNIDYKYDVYEDRKSAEDYLAWCKRWGSEMIRVLRPDGTFWLAIGDEFAAELKVLFTRDLGLYCRSWVVWYYTFGVNCTKKFNRSHVHLFHFVKNPKAFTFNDEIKVPSARQIVYADKRAAPGGRMPDDTWILRPQDVPNGFPAGGDTWFVSRVCGTFKERAGWHGCQMPEVVLARIIRACSNAGDRILDPFTGSGTTLAVAKKLRRRFVGWELSPDYGLRAGQRIDRAKPGDPIEGSEDPWYAGKPEPPHKIDQMIAQVVGDPVL